MFNNTPASPYANLYSGFLNKNKDIDHFACHSHHYWPDVTKDAMNQYWEDSATYVDDKWDLIFGQKIPAVQKHLQNILNFSDPSQCVFGSNTHELVYRLLSTLPVARKKKILTTDSEFYSWDRQIWRLAEDKEIWDIKILPIDPISTFTERFCSELKNTTYDFILLSHVFFNSGIVCPGIDEIISYINPTETLAVIDGYHGFMAVPIDLSRWENKIFYVAGAYKYAQSGEGCCFMVTPPDCTLRPQFTGWFANFFDLSESKSSEVKYGKNGERFWGSTMDFTGLYRFKSVLDLFSDKKITVETIHSYVQQRQNEFLGIIDSLSHQLLNRENLLMIDQKNHGHFFSFKLPTTTDALTLRKVLREHGVATDSRNERLRFGFSIYHPPDYPSLRDKLQKLSYS